MIAAAGVAEPGAVADRGWTPMPPGYVQCNRQLIPADPRLDVRDPLGAHVYRWFLQLCTAGPRPSVPPNM
ncbi:hypothetical protein [Mycobacterium intracellulare]|uniref:hypothetical protein n=1 Tax=Mycobacterium intracellulare TaxID=1767 RepID=UPI0012FD17D3|nr:hypothetical protein [Mycobacterium intracellulare]